ncbi:MAG TPA: IS1 family transposase [Aggregatilineaceae bacterium]|nr:IS1 family transposase [Aggregatilineaceae bacterium]
MKRHSKTNGQVYPEYLFMIQIIITHQCPRCGSEQMVKNGHDYKGAQKYHCKHCHRYGTLFAHAGYDEQTRTQVKRAVLERISLRGLERVLGLSRRTVSRWLIDWAKQLPPLADTLDEARVDDVLELDEGWSFVLKKENQRWIGVALCRRTRQIVAYFIGDRSEASCLQLWRRLPTPYARCHSFSDFWDAYQRIFATDRHQSVRKDSGQTAHIERWFNTLRQHLARFVRKTLSFSKSDRFHEIVFRLFVHHYNQECIS